MLIYILILFPLLAAVALLACKADRVRNVIVRGSAAIIAAVSVYLSATLIGADMTYQTFKLEYLNTAILLIEIALMGYLFVLSMKNRKIIAMLLTLVLVPLMPAFEFLKGHAIEVANEFAIDRLTIIMVCIVGIIGSVITVYAIGYMKNYVLRHPEVKDRRNVFFSVLFLFLSAMFGLIFSNNLTLLSFFWEITTVSSFVLIGYTQSKQAKDNAFRALKINLFGGIAFTAAIILIGYNFGTLELDKLLALGPKAAGILIPVALLCLAGLTKSAQMPFSGWLVGAMVAPTPTSALLHSSTMVKAGIYIILRLSPLLFKNNVGMTVTIIGGITFLIASLIAIAQSDAKKVLAYSTIANLGLVTACAGTGTYEAIWAGILLVIFHAITKSLMFLCVGTVEQKLGTRNIDEMDGLVKILPKLTLMMVIGIAGMFLAPFGMVISKWAALRAFIDSGNVLILLVLVYGSSATLLYWTKWLGKLMSMKAGAVSQEAGISGNEWFAIAVHAVLTVLMIIVFPVVSAYVLEPYLRGVFGQVDINIISNGDIEIMLLMIGMLILLPLGFILIKKTIHYKKSTVYMSGENLGDNLSYRGALGQEMKVSMKNLYLEEYFGEKRLGTVSTVASAAFLIVMFTIIVVGGM